MQHIQLVEGRQLNKAQHIGQRHEVSRYIQHYATPGETRTIADELRGHLPWSLGCISTRTERRWR